MINKNYNIAKRYDQKIDIFIFLKFMINNIIVVKIFLKLNLQFSKKIVVNFSVQN